MPGTAGCMEAAGRNPMDSGEEPMSKNRRLLEAMTEAQTQWFTHQDPAGIFVGLLQALLSVAESEFGFIGEVLRDPEGNPYLKIHAITNIAWNEETRRFYEENAPRGLEFRNLKTLFGAVMVTGETVISNDPPQDPRRGGLPEGHPPLNSFLGIPIYAGGEMVGMSGIANRPGGYDDELVEFLHPFTTMCGNLIHAFRTRRDRDQARARFEEERVRLKAILDGAVDAIITMDTGGKIESANPSVETILGYTPEELLGRSVTLLMPEPHRDLHESYVTRYLETGQAAVIGIGREVEAARKDGSLVPIDLTVTEVALPDRKLFTGILRDIARRRAAERALKESEERLDLALRAADLGTWDWDVPKGRFLSSPRMTAMLGYEPDEIEPTIGGWEALAHPDDLPGVRDNLQEHFQGDRPLCTAEIRLRDKSGKWRWVHLIGQLVSRTPDGKPLRAVGVQSDISARKKAEADILEALEVVGKGHEDLLSLLNLLRIGTVTLEENGTISFLSEFCERIEGLDRTGATGKIWEEVLPFDPASQEKIRESMKQKEPDRQRLSLYLESPSGRNYALECDVRDDPREPDRRILFLYDVTETEILRTRLAKGQSHLLVGSSPPMIRLYERIERVSGGDWTVMIEGETGAGKELVARAIHATSPRHRGPFLAVNCAGLPESILASQLFGHRRGAFTGASSDQEGYFEAAAGGTIFLDEIG
ncbi:MAG: PAS domain S-box protein, partial [Deltaproteobacteria bacterium]